MESEPTRRELCNALQNVERNKQSSVIFEFLMSRLNIPPNACSDIKRGVRQCATRFVAAFNERKDKCHRKLDVFNRKYRDWLDGVPTYPAQTQTVMGTVQSIQLPEESPEFLDREAQVVPDPPILSFAESSDELSLHGHTGVPHTQTFSPNDRASPDYSCSPVPKRGRPPKSFSECCPRVKRRKTEKLRLETNREELFFSVVKVLHQEGFHSAAKAVSRILENPEGFDLKRPKNRESQLSPQESLGLFVETGSSRRDYQVLRNYATANNSILVPPYSSILQAKSECYPEGMVFTETSAHVPLQMLLNHTISRIFQIDSINFGHLRDCEIQNLKLYCKLGMDGSGSHSTYRQQFQDGSGEVGCDTHVFTCSLVPLRLSVADQSVLLWENPKPSSTIYCRILRFKFVKESKQVVKDFHHQVSEEISSLNPTELLLCGRQVSIKHELQWTMVDGKVINILTDTSSRTCYLCGATPSEINDLPRVCERATEKRWLQFGATPLHCKLRCMDALISIAKKQDLQKERASGDVEKSVVMARHNLIQQAFKSKMSLLIDIPLAGSGNTNNGNTARRFFADPTQTAAILGIDRNLVHRVGELNRMLSSSHPVDPEVYREYAIETGKLYVELYPWYPMTPTLHKIIVHGADIIKESPVPVGWLSEEAQESLNKIVRNSRQNNAFKGSRTRTNEDVFKRNMLWSDPLISSIRLKKQPNVM